MNIFRLGSCSSSQAQERSWFFTRLLEPVWQVSFYIFRQQSTVPSAPVYTCAFSHSQTGAFDAPPWPIGDTCCSTASHLNRGNKPVNQPLIVNTCCVYMYVSVRACVRACARMCVCVWEGTSAPYFLVSLKPMLLKLFHTGEFLHNHMGAKVFLFSLPITLLPQPASHYLGGEQISSDWAGVNIAAKW